MTLQIIRITRYVGLTVWLLLSACSPASPFSPAQPAEISSPEAAIPTAEMPQITATKDTPQIFTTTASAKPTVTQTNATPTIEIKPSVLPPAGPTLAFLKDGDIWLLDEPTGQPYPLTITGDITSFAWSPGGERLAAFNGKALCFIHRDGSVRTACLDLGLNDDQAKIVRPMVLSPDQRWIVFWNASNPEEAGTIGWLIVALDTSNIVYRIQDPIDWDADLLPENEPGGFTGQPIFLADGSLIGTLSHRSLCNNYGCQYQLHKFDFDTRTFLPYPVVRTEDSSRGKYLALSSDSSTLASFGVLISRCDDYYTRINLINIYAETYQTYDLESEALSGISPFNDLSRIVISRASACSPANQQTWAVTCGLSEGAEIQAMQVWTLDSNERKELLPGLMPTISPDNEWLAFRSCLKKEDSGNWIPDEGATPEIFLLNLLTSETIRVDRGTTPQWRPGY